MNPQEQLDPQAVNLAKAIRAVETGSQKDPWKARGGSQEYGAYQFTPNTWNRESQKHLGRVVPLEQATPQEQNEVAYKSIKEMKDRGLNPGQIASMWNSGKPDAYLDPQYTGVNKYGVRYDVPQYAASVAKAYQSIKGSGEPTVTPITASTVGHEQYAKGPLGTDPRDSLTDKILDNSVTRTIQKIFPGEKVGRNIGILGGLAYTKAKDLLTGTDATKHYDISGAATLPQVGGDIAQGALMVGTGLPGGGATTTAGKTFLGGAKGLNMAKTAIGRIGQNALIGTGIGATGAIAEGKQGEDIIKEGVIGGGLGIAGGVAGELLNKVAQTLPKRFLRSTVTNINDETAEYAVKKGLGTPSKMLRESEASIKTLGNELGETLKNPKYKDITFGAEDIVDDVIKKYPDAELTPEIVLGEMKKLAKLKSGLITKLEQGGRLTLPEVHSLNSELGSNVFKTVFDDPAVKAGKDVGSAVYHTISDRLKTTAPETVPIFETLSKEYPLRKALGIAINRVGKHKAINLRDLMAIIGGGALAGPLGAAGAFVGEKLLTSPTANMAAGGLISKFGGSTGVVKPLLLRNITKNVNPE